MTTTTHGSVLIFEGKSSDQLFDASTPERRALAFLTVLRERMDEGYWYIRPEEPVFDEATHDLAYMKDEAFFSTSGLPESVASDLYQKHVAAKQRMRNARADYERENEWFVKADAVLALSTEEFLATVGPRRNSVPELLLNERADYEYEGIEEQRMSVVTL